MVCTCHLFSKETFGTIHGRALTAATEWNIQTQGILQNEVGLLLRNALYLHGCHLMTLNMIGGDYIKS